MSRPLGLGHMAVQKLASFARRNQMEKKKGPGLLARGMPQQKRDSETPHFDPVRSRRT